MQIIEATREAIAGASLQKTSHTQTQGKQETTGAAGSQSSSNWKIYWKPVGNTSMYIGTQTIVGTIFSKQNTRITLVIEIHQLDIAREEITLFESIVWLFEQYHDAWLQLRERGETLTQQGTKTIVLLPNFEAKRERQTHIATLLPDADQAHVVDIGMAEEE